MLLSQKKLFGTNCFISNTACRLQIQTMNLEKDPESVHSLDKKKVLVTQSCLTPCNSMNCIVHGVTKSQTRLRIGEGGPGVWPEA